MSKAEGKAKVIIFTKYFQIKGDIFLFEGARLTDYMLDAKSFIAVSSAEVMDHQKNKVFTTSFLNVNRDHIEIILPAELRDSQ